MANGVRGAEPMGADGLGILSREQFVGLARRCRLALESGGLEALAGQDIMPPARVGEVTGYWMGHIWLLARYLREASVLIPPWEPWPAVRPVGARSAMRHIKEDARAMNVAVAWALGRDPDPAPPEVEETLAALRTFLDASPVLGTLRQVLPLLRPDVRASLRGEALMMELIHSAVERLESALAERAAAAPSQEPPAAAQQAPVAASPSSTSSPGASSPGASSPVGEPDVAAARPAPAASKPEPVAASAPAPSSPDAPVDAPAPAPAHEPATPSAAMSAPAPETPPVPAALDSAGDTIPVDVQPDAAAPEAVEGSEPPLSTAADALHEPITAPLPAVDGTRRPDSGSSFQVPGKGRKVEGTDGLRSALARAREAAERRTAEADARVRERPRPRTMELAVVGSLEHVDPEAPSASAQPAPQDASGEVGDSLEAQVQRLNEMRHKHTQDEAWDKLVKLFEEGLYLFPDAASRRGVHMYVGALYERKLHDTEGALGAYHAALACAPGDREPYLAVERLLAAAERWDELLEIMDEALDGEPEPELRFEIQLRRASLLATVLDRHHDALEQYREQLAYELDRDQLREVLAGLSQLARIDGPDAETLLAAATILEGYWAVEPHVDELIQLYEDMFDLLQPRDKASAAEVMSRLASCYQGAGRLRSAFVSLVRALHCNPERSDVFDRLEALAERLGGLRELAAIYEDDFEDVLGHRHRAMLGRRLARIHEKLGDLDGVRRAWQSICDADPFDVEALIHLADLDQRAGQFSVLIETLERLRSLVDGDDRTRLLLRLATIRLEGLTKPSSPAADVLDIDAAVTALQDALSGVEHGSTMAGAVIKAARELIAGPSKPLAYQLVELLDPFFTQHGDYRAVVDTYELLISHHLDSPADRVEAGRMMTRVGQLHEEQLDQGELAFLYYARALRVDPQCDEALGRLQDLAEQDGRLDELAGLYEEILDGGRVAVRDLWLKRLARLYDQQLGNPARAAHFYQLCYEHQRDDDETLDFLESHHTQRGQWNEVIDVLLTRAELEGSVPARKALLERVAALSLEQLGDVTLALGSLRKALTMDPDDPALIERIVALHRSEGDLEGLADFLSLQEELTRDADTSAELMMRRAELLAGDLRQPGEALEVLTRLRDDRPDDPEVLRRMESLYTAEGRDIEAYAALKSLAELLAAPGSVAETHDGEVDQILMRLAGMAETVLHSADEAAVHYRRLLARDPHNLQAIGQLERIHEEHGNWHELVEVLRLHARLMETQGESIAAAVLIERQLEIATEHMQDVDLEFEALAGLLRLGHDLNLGQFERLAELARARERWKLCLEANEGFVALMADPADQAAILQEMATVASAQMGDEPLATAFLERALDACPNDPTVLGRVAECFRRDERWPKLAECWRAQLDLDESLSHDQRVRLGRDLAEVLDKHLAEPRQAVGMLERVLGMVREAPDKVSLATQDSVRRRAILLYARLDEFDAVLTHQEALHAALVARGTTGEALARLREDMARTCLKLDRPQDAEGHFLTAIEEDERSPAARLGLAELHVAAERWTEATVLLEDLAETLDAFSNAQERGRVLAGLGRAYAATNKASKAVEAYQKALEHDPDNATAREAMA